MITRTMARVALSAFVDDDSVKIYLESAGRIRSGRVKIFEEPGLPNTWIGVSSWTRDGVRRGGRFSPIFN